MMMFMNNDSLGFTASGKRRRSFASEPARSKRGRGFGDAGVNGASNAWTGFGARMKPALNINQGRQVFRKRQRSFELYDITGPDKKRRTLGMDPTASSGNDNALLPTGSSGRKRKLESLGPDQASRTTGPLKTYNKGVHKHNDLRRSTQVDKGKTNKENLDSKALYDKPLPLVKVPHSSYDSSYVDSLPRWKPEFPFTDSTTAPDNFAMVVWDPKRQPTPPIDKKDGQMVVYCNNNKTNPALRPPKLLLNGEQRTFAAPQSKDISTASTIQTQHPGARIGEAFDLDDFDDSAPAMDLDM